MPRRSRCALRINGSISDLMLGLADRAMLYFRSAVLNCFFFSLSAHEKDGGAKDRDAR